MKACFVRGNCTVFTLLALAWFAGRGQADDWADRAEKSDPVVLHLHSSTRVSGSEVRVGNICLLEGRDSTLRARIEQLDIADSPEPGKLLRISRDHIAYRLQLAGLDKSQFVITGAQAVVVGTQTCEISTSELLEAARRSLVDKLGPNPADYEIRVSQPPTGPVHVPGKREVVQFQGALQSTRSLLGKVPMNVQVLCNGIKHAEVPVVFEVDLVQNVAVARQRIERGQPLTADKVSFDRRVVQAAAEIVTDNINLAEYRAKRTILPTQLIATTDVESARDSNDVLVKSKDVVEIVARAGALKVMAHGEVLQDGRAGQIIRVRNLRSEKIVHGRVINRSVVEVIQ